MKLRAMIVDDEPLARERVRTLLAAEPDVTVLAECGSGVEALAAMEQERPDVLFLDVQMPEIDGFQLLQALPPPLPVVIFVTAFDEHAVRAFDAQALDYLLKPFKPERFRAALARARDQVARQTPAETTRRLMALLEHSPRAEHLSRIAVRDRNRVRFIKTTDVDWIESSGNYVVVHAGREKHIVRETLAAFEAQLAPREFARLSRSAIVRLDRVQHIEPAFDNEHVVVLADGTRLTMTRGVRELHERMKFG
jgi:two-component system, LytTR family, response regulator